MGSYKKVCEYCKKEFIAKVYINMLKKFGIEIKKELTH